VTIPPVTTRPPPPVIHLQEFEGPLDLLLQLVERRRLPIAELSLVAVADQYLAQVRAMSRVDADVLSEFVAIGARLLLLKSRSLLPAIEPPPQPGEDEETDGEELVRRLETYRAFKLLAEELGRLDAAGLASYAGGSRVFEATPEQLPLQAIAPHLLASLHAAIERRRTGPPEQTDESVPRISVAERIFLLRDRLQRAGHVAWNDVCGGTVDEIVATLLAVLELVRRGEMTVVQPSLFGPIRLQAADPMPPAATSEQETTLTG
jgi:segregation and condensation protein A